ncbi:MAG: hypothetical protein Q8L29_01135 [archaeon]|nr:hypothetical protein [archaeon]
MPKAKDVTAELSEYIKKNLKKGYTKDSLKWALVSQGYSKMEIEKALKSVDIELAQEVPVLKTTTTNSVGVIRYESETIEKKSFWKNLFG